MGFREPLHLTVPARSAHREEIAHPDPRSPKGAKTHRIALESAGNRLPGQKIARETGAQVPNRSGSHL